MKKRLIVVAPIIVGLIILFVNLPFIFPGTVAQAQCFLDIVVPSFGLTTTDAQIENENVQINIDDFEAQYGQNYATIESCYTIRKTKGSTADFALPIISKVRDPIDISVSIDDEPVSGHIKYGKPFFDYQQPNTSELLADVLASDLTDAPDGTLYIFTPTKTTLTIEMRLNADQPLIYDTTNALSSYTGSGFFNLTLKETTPGDKYYFYIGNGDFLVPPVSNSDYTKQTLHCKDFIDGFCATWHEYYDEVYKGVSPNEYFYAEMQRGLNGYLRKTTHEFFLDGIESTRGNAYCFSAPQDKDVITVKVRQKAEVQINPEYEPFVFKMSYIPTGQHPTDITFNLNEQFPYLVDSNVAVKKKTEKIYLSTAVTSSDTTPYFVFSSVEQPTLKTYGTSDATQLDNRLRIVLAVCIPVGCVCAAGIAILIVCFVKSKHRQSN